MILHRVEADKWGESCLEVETMEDSKVRSRIREQRELVSKLSNFHRNHPRATQNSKYSATPKIERNPLYSLLNSILHRKGAHTKDEHDLDKEDPQR